MTWSSFLATFFEFLPIGLAVVAAVLCSRQFGRARRHIDRAACALGVLCATLLIFAQTSWWASYRIHGLGYGTDFANHLWTIFNTLSMSAFVALGWPRK